MPPDHEYTKSDVLQVLLEAMKLAGELFDAVEADGLLLDPRMVGNLGGLVLRLDAIHVGLVQEFIFSGRAADFILDDLRRGLSPPD